MELSCFSEEQLTVRDAIGKICSNFPDVCMSPWILQLRFAVCVSPWSRNTGPSVMSRANIPMSFTLPYPRMVGLGSRYPKSWEELGWVFRRLR
jgi:hypothetical protein